MSPPSQHCYFTRPYASNSKHFACCLSLGHLPSPPLPSFLTAWLLLRLPVWHINTLNYTLLWVGRKPTLNKFGWRKQPWERLWKRRKRRTILRRRSSSYKISEKEWAAEAEQCSLYWREEGAYSKFPDSYRWYIIVSQAASDLLSSLPLYSILQ